MGRAHYRTPPQLQPSEAPAPPIGAALRAHRPNPALVRGRSGQALVLAEIVRMTADSCDCRATTPAEGVGRPSLVTFGRKDNYRLNGVASAGECVRSACQLVSADAPRPYGLLRHYVRVRS